jgi:peptidyl-prolyl cis-trans isomerase SurA
MNVAAQTNAMPVEKSAIKRIAIICLVAALGFGGLAGFHASQAFAASKIVATVDTRAITNNDIRRRAALLRLQRRKGNLNNLAREELIEEALKLNEAQRRNVRVPESRVDSAFAGFARNNKLSERQLRNILTQSGVGVRGFKDFIRAQIAWNALVSSRVRATGSGATSINDQLFATSARAQTNEYVLQQVVLFATGRNKRVSEAKAIRSGFTSCEATLGQVQGYSNAVVRSLGRISEDRLPPEWKKFIIGTNEGATTAVRSTDRGAEFIAVCRKNSIGKEGGSEPGFELGVSGGEKAEEVSKKYLAELRERAVIR